jgi:hypothetical protein
MDSPTENEPSSEDSTEHGQLTIKPLWMQTKPFVVLVSAGNILALVALFWPWLYIYSSAYTFPPAQVYSPWTMIVESNGNILVIFPLGLFVLALGMAVSSSFLLTTKTTEQRKHILAIAFYFAVIGLGISVGMALFTLLVTPWALELGDFPTYATTPNLGAALEVAGFIAAFIGIRLIDKRQPLSQRLIG